MQQQSTILPIESANPETRSALDEIIREGAQRLLAQAIEAEVAEYIERHQSERDEDGHRMVVRNGRLPERRVATGAGLLEIRQPRVDDRREGHRFTSAILPRYARRSPSLDVLIPVLYLKGVSTGNFSDALESILGANAPGLSASTVTRLIEQWQTEYHDWMQRDLSGSRYVYVWCDGIYSNVRLTDERPCMLVVIGATVDGRKELLAVSDGERESAMSWKELLLDMKRRGLDDAPELAIGDGALGFWAACEEVWPQTRQQNCWVHKTVNVLDKLPKKLHSVAKTKLHDIYQSPTKADALKQLQTFRELYGPKYPKAVASIERVRDRLLSFYDFPAEHWQHIRSTNVIESAFATVRHRQRQTKGNGSRNAAVAMIYKLGREAEKSWRRLTGHQAIVLLLNGVRFTDGEAEHPDDQRQAA